MTYSGRISSQIVDNEGLIFRGPQPSPLSPLSRPRKPLSRVLGGFCQVFSLAKIYCLVNGVKSCRSQTIAPAYLAALDSLWIYIRLCVRDVFAPHELIASMYLSSPQDHMDIPLQPFLLGLVVESHGLSSGCMGARYISIYISDLGVCHIVVNSLQIF